MPVLVSKSSSYPKQGGAQQNKGTMKKEPFIPLLHSALSSPEHAFWHDRNGTGEERFCC